MKSPTAKAMDECRVRDWVPWKAEYFNVYTSRSHDLFGFIDVVALAPFEIWPWPDGQPSTFGIQVTKGDNNHALRRHKIFGPCRDNAMLWLRCGNRILLWSYVQRAKRDEDGKLVKNKDGSTPKRKPWVLREEEITLEELDTNT